jgi:hypothetical protein
MNNIILNFVYKYRDDNKHIQDIAISKLIRLFRDHQVIMYLDYFKLIISNTFLVDNNIVYLYKDKQDQVEVKLITCNDILQHINKKIYDCPSDVLLILFKPLYLSFKKSNNINTFQISYFKQMISHNYKCDKNFNIIMNYDNNYLSIPKDISALPPILNNYISYN